MHVVSPKLRQQKTPPIRQAENHVSVTRYCLRSLVRSLLRMIFQLISPCDLNGSCGSEDGESSASGCWGPGLLCLITLFAFIRSARRVIANKSANNLFIFFSDGWQF